MVRKFRKLITSLYICKDVGERNISDGYLEIVGNKLRLTRKGLFYGNDVFSEFLLN